MSNEKWKRFKWGEISWELKGPRLSIDQFHDPYEAHTLIIGLGLVTFYIKVGPFIPNMECMESGYGFYFQRDAFVWHWGKKCTFFNFPWQWQFYKRWELVKATSYARGREAFVEVPNGFNHGVLGTKETFPYKYKLRNGTVQERTATVYVDRMEWRMRWLKWLPWPRKTQTCIDIEFNDEVGERTGSWKGGVLGCGYEMKPGETAQQTLARMEREREFK